MIAATSRGVGGQTGMRPFDPFRDLKPVAELITAAFGDTLDPTGQAALAEIHRIARWGPLLWWLYWPRWDGVGVAPGFVWVEGGRVVGNVSLRRALERGGFLIGNVAVHPDWRGRGIASTLMRAALEEIAARGGRWVGLEVRVGNELAYQMYRHLNFHEVGRVTHMLRPAGLAWEGDAAPHRLLRRGRGRDETQLIELVRSTVPASLRPLLELRQEDYRPGWGRALDHWLSGRRESWWVVEDDGVVCGAVRTLRERGRRPDRLEVLVAPTHRGRLDSLLVRQGVASLCGARKRMIEAVLPGPGEELVAALEAEGFRELRVLAHMRLDLA